jgi:glutamate-ammonia-ligase adenylyltransferase
VEFIAQYLELRHAHGNGAVVSAATGTALARLAEAGHLAREDADRLIAAERLWRALLGMLRLTFAGQFDEQQAPPGLKAALARAAGAGDFESLKRQMHGTAADVFAIFERLISCPTRRASDGPVRTQEGSVHRTATSEEEL